MSLFPDLHHAPFQADAFAGDIRANVLKLIDLHGPMDALTLCARYRRLHGAHIAALDILHRLVDLVESGEVEQRGEPSVFARKDAK